ncbi:MAG TPA: hypothetical protein VI541_00585 [Actinomycetota bacterium]|nr:hypothetical protein [Actinomycetota bacterium]
MNGTLESSEPETWLAALANDNFPGRLQSCVVAFIPFGGLYLGTAFLLDRFTVIPWMIIQWTFTLAYVSTGAILLGIAVSPLAFKGRLRVAAAAGAVAVALTAVATTVIYLIKGGT